MKSISGVFMEEKDEYPYMHIMACFAHDLFALAWRMPFACSLSVKGEGREGIFLCVFRAHGTCTDVKLSCLLSLVYDHVHLPCLVSPSVLLLIHVIRWCGSMEDPAARASVD